MEEPLQEPPICQIWHMDTKETEDHVDNMSKTDLKKIVGILSHYNKKQRELKLKANAQIVHVISNPTPDPVK